MTCPYRIAPEHGCTQAASVSGDTLLKAVQRRELGGRYAQLAVMYGSSTRFSEQCRTMHAKKSRVMQAAELKGYALCMQHISNTCGSSHPMAS